VIEFAAIVLTVLVIGNAGVMLYYTWRVRRLRRRGLDLKDAARQVSQDSRATKDLWAQVEQERRRYEAAAEQAKALALDPPLELATFERLEREYMGRLCCGLTLTHRHGSPGIQVGVKGMDRERALVILDTARRQLLDLPQWPESTNPTDPPATPGDAG